MNAARLGLATIAALLVALPMAGQVTGGRPNTHVNLQERHAALPYTAQFKVTTERILANGTRITHEDTDLEAVDSRGWKLTAITRTPISSDQQVVTHTSILEPDQGIILDWYSPDPRSTVASRSIHRPIDQSCGSNGTIGSTTHLVTPVLQAQRSQSIPATEDLGTETIQGVEARGRRTTTTIPVGKIGNDQPLVRTSEIWIAIDPGLRHLVVRSVIDDPAQGRNERELVSFEQGDPDEAQFEPPPGYQIVPQETGSTACSASTTPGGPTSDQQEGPPAPAGDSSQ